MTWHSKFQKILSGKSTAVDLCLDLSSFSGLTVCEIRKQIRDLFTEDTNCSGSRVSMIVSLRR